MMVEFMIEEMSPELYQRLKEQAEAHHHSLEQEALAILEAVLLVKRKKKDWTPPPPIQGKVVFTQEMIDEAKREGRA